jgi:hypothetical protein
MNRLWSYATLLLARFLDPREREVALGDVAELGLEGRRGFAGMLGLVMRRQLQPWKRTQAWLVLFAMVLPIATLLAFSSNDLSAQLFPPLIMWLRHHGSYSTGVTPGAEVFGLLLEVTAIVLGSWSCGFAVGTLSHGTRFVDGLLFFVTLLVAMSAAVTPFSLFSFRCTWWGVLPVVIAFLLILAPGYYGLSRGVSRIQVRGLVGLAIATGVLGVLTAWVQGWGAAAMENWSQGGSALTLIQLMRSKTAWVAVIDSLFAIFVLTLPVLYLLVRQRKIIHQG